MFQITKSFYKKFRNSIFHTIQYFPSSPKNVANSFVSSITLLLNTYKTSKNYVYNCDNNKSSILDIIYNSQHLFKTSITIIIIMYFHGPSHLSLRCNPVSVAYEIG